MLFSKERKHESQTPQKTDEASSALFHRRLGEILRKEGYISDFDLEVVLTEQEAIGDDRFGVIAQRLGIVTEKQLTKALGKQCGLGYFDLRSEWIDPAVANMLDSSESRRRNVLPLYKEEDGTIVIGLADPTDIKTKDRVKQLLGTSKLKYVAIERSQLTLVQANLYQDLNFRKRVKSIAADLSKGSDINEATARTEVPRLVNSIIWDALASRASDVHLVFSADIFRVFYRISGELKYVFALRPELFQRVSAQIKQVAGMDVGERMSYGDGMWAFNAGDRTVNIRVSKMPTVPIQEGESLVLRILDQSQVSLDIETLGFYEEDIEVLDAVKNLPYGMVLVTGPTGSGKTTTLYSLLSSMSVFSQNVITVENPVEYQIPGIRQVQVNEKAGITFSSALRTFLRQDPDVILVGEVRDADTAKIATNAAVTGHLVLSTLHTNDAVSAIPRLIDFDVDGNSLQSSVSCVIAQRLVRKVCGKCAVEREPTDTETVLYEANEIDVPATVVEPDPESARSCSMCTDGYTKPTVVYELFKVDSEVRDMIRPETPFRELHNIALKKGMRTMLQSALMKAADHVTSMAEVKKISG